MHLKSNALVDLNLAEDGVNITSGLINSILCYYFCSLETKTDQSICSLKTLMNGNTWWSRHRWPETMSAVSRPHDPFFSNLPRPQIFLSAELCLHPQRDSEGWWREEGEDDVTVRRATKHHIQGCSSSDSLFENSVGRQISYRGWSFLCNQNIWVKYYMTEFTTTVSLEWFVSDRERINPEMQNLCQSGSSLKKI